MRKRLGFYLFLFSLILTFIPVTVFADLKFKCAPYLRLRHEYWKNIYDMNNDLLDNRNYFRVKTSLWAQADHDKDFSLFIKLTDEFKAYTYYAPSSAKLTGKTDKGYNFDINEAVFDNIYLDIKNALGLPVDLRLGRQDLSSSAYGEGFIFADGTPRDGSRTFYFNAAKALWRVCDKNTLEFIFINANKSDDMLPVINRQDGEQMLNYGDDTAYVLYHKNDRFKDLHLENYYIYKREGADRPSPYPEKSIINTLGLFARYNFTPWVFRGQFAYQFGSYGTHDRQAFGGYAYLDRDLKSLPLAPQVSAGYYYLSGNERSSNRYEGFSQLFSTYTWMSELYNMSYSMETGTGYWTNLQMWRLSLLLNTTKKSKVTLVYNFLRANETQTGVHASFGDGRNRGHLPQARLDYAFNKSVSAYFLAEYFIPGNFYVDKSDAAVFLRTELQFKF